MNGGQNVGGQNVGWAKCMEGKMSEGKMYGGQNESGQKVGESYFIYMHLKVEVESTLQPCVARRTVNTLRA